MRERRQRGFRCFQIEISKADIDALVAHGFLDRMRRHEPGAVRERSAGSSTICTVCDARHGKIQENATAQYERRRKEKRNNARNEIY